MNRYVTLLAILICSVGLGLLFIATIGCDSSTLITSSTPLVDGPQLTITESFFDFGMVPQHSRISHVFWLHSTGSEPLRIVKVVPG